MQQFKNIKTFEDACKDLGIGTNLPDVSNIPEQMQKFVLSTYRMAIIARALNRKEDGSYWEPDWTDFNEYKYYPWFALSVSSGFALDAFGCTNAFTASLVGSRLVFREEEIAEYAATQFEEDYRNIHVIS